jgi:hypothetical protein
LINQEKSVKQSVQYRRSKKQDDKADLYSVRTERVLAKQDQNPLLKFSILAQIPVEVLLRDFGRT